MKTSEFLERIESGAISKERTLSSIYFDGRHAYSYGRHYPLMVRLDLADDRHVFIVNDRGYSVSTSRHISHAKSANYPRTLAVHLQGSDKTPANIIESAKQEIEKSREYITVSEPKVEKNPRYTGIQNRINDARARIALLEQVIDIAKVAEGYKPGQNAY